MFLWWGEDLIQFYNDAYRPSLGNHGKHPTALGGKGADTWQEIWGIISPLIEQVRTTGEATWSEDQLIPIYRNGQMEDVYWTFGYSPVIGDDNQIGGVLVVCTETTDKVVNLQKLKASNERFRSMVMQSPVAIAVFRGDEFIAEIVNDAYLPLVGKTREEFEGRPLFATLPETRKILHPLALEVARTGTAFPATEFELMITRKGKDEVCYFNSVWEPLVEADGKINGFIAVAHEVTEQVIARKKTEEKEQQIRALVESAPFPIGVYTGREMRIQLANQSIIETWGKGADVQGRLYADILPEVGDTIYSQLDNVYTTGAPYHARNTRVDLLIGDRLMPHYFNYSFTPLFDGEGKVYGVMNTAADVTDLNLAKQKIEENEQSFRNTILKAPVAMCIFKGPQHLVEIANDKMIELWGKTINDVLGKPIFEGLPEARDQGFETILDDVYRTGKTFSAQRVPITLPRNGKVEIVYVNFVYEAYKEAGGEVSGILAVATDVSQQVFARQKIEEIVAERTKELGEANRKLQKTNAELAQFAYIASHDLQEPLRKVSTFAEMLGNNLVDIDERSKTYLGKITQATARMLALIRDVLTYSQLAREDNVFPTVDLNEIVAQVQTDFELLIEQKLAVIDCSQLPVINAIPLQMSQLFGNLISNSLKFTKEGVPPVISITSRLLTQEEIKRKDLPEGGTYYNIEVRDNGIGFNREYAAQIFNIFQRLHGKSSYAGTGIGLAICKKITQNHNGDIDASNSSETNGAVFNIILPQTQG